MSLKFQVVFKWQKHLEEEEEEEKSIDLYEGKHIELHILTECENKKKKKKGLMM